MLIRDKHPGSAPVSATLLKSWTCFLESHEMFMEAYGTFYILAVWTMEKIIFGFDNFRVSFEPYYRITIIYSFLPSAWASWWDSWNLSRSSPEPSPPPSWKRILLLNLWNEVLKWLLGRNGTYTVAIVTNSSQRKTQLLNTFYNNIHFTLAATQLSSPSQVRKRSSTARRRFSNRTAQYLTIRNKYKCSFLIREG